MSKDPFDWLGALLLIGGTAAFLWGGAQHPATDSSLGPLGSADYFRAFAEHVAAFDGWTTIHVGILAGPVLWSLGIHAVAGRGRDGPGEKWTRLGVHAMGLGAIAWAVVFVVDGFVAPLNAAAVLEAGSPASIAAFRADQEVVIRLGLVAWLLLGFGVAVSSIASLLGHRPARSTLARSGLGLAVGLWPILALLSGEFVPGPFTSELWTATATTTSAWFAWSGLAMVWRSAPGSKPIGGAARS